MLFFHNYLEVDEQFLNNSIKDMNVYKVNGELDLFR